MTSGWVRFRDKAEDILGIGANMVMALSPFVGLIPGVPAGAVRILRLVPVLMHIVQVAHPAEGAGPAKKSAVMAASKAAMDELDKQLTGGAQGTFDKLQPVIESLLEGTIGMVNQFAPKIIADDKPGLTPGEQMP